MVAQLESSHLPQKRWIKISKQLRKKPLKEERKAFVKLFVKKIKGLRM